MTSMTARALPLMLSWFLASTTVGVTNFAWSGRFGPVLRINLVSSPKDARFSRMHTVAFLFASINVTSLAPRDSASIPSAPLPAKASSTVAPGR